MTITSQNTVTVTMPAPTDVRVERRFNAPRQKVWDAHTKPELLRQWLLGPDGWTMPVCEVDLRPGGGYRYEWANADGGTMATRGTYVEVSPIDRLVFDEHFDEPWYPGECITTLELSEEAGVTHLVMTMRWDDQEARDTAVATGMNDGIVVSLDRMADIIEQS